MTEANERRGAVSTEAPGRRLVPLALRFYGVLLLVALAWRLAVDGELPLHPAGGPRSGLPAALALGAAAAGVVVAISELFTARSRLGRRLAAELASVLGPLSIREIAVLAAASGVAEEAFFRGALQPRVGLVAASLLFGLAHLAPRRDLLPWTAFALLAGFLLGALFEWTGQLAAPLVAHVLVNAVNLHRLQRFRGSRAEWSA